MQTRTEVDSLGKKPVPKGALYGIQTLRAVENFPVSGIKAPRVFIHAYARLSPRQETQKIGQKQSISFA